MSEEATEPIQRGQRLVAANGRTIGTVDAVFADYLLVRTGMACCRSTSTSRDRR